MSFNVAMLEAMQAEGLSLEQCIRILRAGGPDSAVEKRRAYDRERKREKREAERLSGGKSGGNPPDPAPNEIDILTPTRVEKTEPKGSSKKPDQETVQAIGTCLRRAFPPPEGVTDEQWAAFRKQRRKAINDRSYALLTSKLAKLAEDGWPPGEMIDLAIERGWETVFAPRNFGNERSDRDPTTVALERLIGPHAGTG